MNKYISVDQLWNCETCYHHLGGKCNTWCDGGESYHPDYSKFKFADVVPVRHGRWGTHSDRPDSLICSVCNCGFDMWKHDPHNYCPNCGAKMDGE